jgi:hypothetical protein
MNTRKIRGLVTATLALTVLSCESSRITSVEPKEVAAEPSDLLGLPIFPRKLYCPTSTAQSATQEIGPLGGIISVAGTSISVPLGALLNTVTMTVTVPASNWMEIDVSVAGVESFLFESPVAVTVSYARCTSVWLLTPPLTAWYINSETKALISPMPSVDNRLLRTVTFTTGHLTGFILAN